MIRGYLEIFGPVFVVGAAIGFGGHWWARAWKRQPGGIKWHTEPSPHRPREPVSDAEWAAIVRAITEDSK
jgi:hypothetical protein